MVNERSDQQSLFESFAKKLCDYAMKRYVIPYIQNHGVVQSYRATVISKDTVNKTMTVMRPFDTPVTIPYSDGVSGLMAGDSCVVFVLGQPSNAVVAADGKMNFTA